MRLIIIGCEYVGKSTFVAELKKWMLDTLGSCTTSFHDHFVMPFGEGGGPEEEEKAQQILHMNRALLERHVDYMMNYHASPSFYDENDHCLVNWYFGDAVYAPLYYGYGRAGEYADRRVMARYYDKKVMEIAPDTVLVLLKASPEVIRQRMKANPHYLSPLLEQDVELVLKRFEEEYGASLIRHKLILDSTTASPADLLAEFVRQIERYLNENDKLRILAHRALHP